ncbi:PKD domain-containing protein [Cerasicoccus fimbriatus]|uniref:PKD domain-containing protein n=1 Tax=Cerasicoccus fimbriatus TaxID=3014554 RepID=UPI0022B47193|nr:PKD domain-containing protein [Cerasicoccus sp. TK19100]
MNRKRAFGLLWSSLTLSLILAPVAHALWNYPGTGDWTPPANHFGTQYEPSRVITVPMEAVVSEDPAEITLKFYSSPDSSPGFGSSSVYDTDLSGTYDIFRKDPDALSWGAAIGSVTIGDTVTTWTDSNVTPGVAYEYGVYPTEIVDDNVSLYLKYAHGNVIAGINVDRTDAKGRIVIVVAEDVLTELPEEYGQYKEDLKRDGWLVHEITTPRAADYTSNGTGPNDANGVPGAPYPDEHINIRNQIIQIYNDHPGEVKNVSIVGKVAVARSGVGYIGPDGHGNRHSAGADAYYADMDGVWTDTGSNLSSYSSSLSTAISQGRINVPGDNKFDPDQMSQVGGPNKNLELGFGRIDFSNQIGAEYASLRNYFNKLHRYKTASPDFRPGRRAVHRSGFGALAHEFMGSMPGVVGMENMDFTRSSELPNVPDNLDADAAYTAQGNPYLFYFKGNGGPGISNGSQAVFWTGMQSHWGYWFESTVTSSQNAMSSRLAEDNFTLSYTWSIALFNWDVNFLYHRFGMGGNAGDMMRASMSNRASGTIYNNANSPMFMNHMGDPALRLFMFPPPTDLQVTGSSNPTLSWSASTAPAGEPQVIGYHVYRSASADGPFTRLTTAPIAGTSYVDDSVSSGAWYYQVKAVRLEASGGGTYYNSSLAAEQSIDLDATLADVVVTAAILPEANWDTDYYAALEATGGNPLYTWQVVSGSLPAGLTLSTRGVLSGKPTEIGDFDFTVEATDALGESAQESFSLTVVGLDVQVVEAEASAYVRENSTSYTSRSYEPALHVADGYMGYLRFDLSSVEQNVNFVSAKLVLSIDDSNVTGSNVVIEAALGVNSDDDWDETTITYDTMPDINEAIPSEAADQFPVPGGTVTIDVSYMVYEILLNDPSKLMTVRLHSETSVSWQNWARVMNRHATSSVRPKLIIQTAGTEGFDPPPPPPPPPAPVASFTAFPVSGRQPLEVTFTDESTGAISSRSWDFGDGNTLATTETSVTHTYDTAGNYTVALTATGPGGSHTDTQVDVIEVLDALAGLRIELNPDTLDQAWYSAGETSGWYGNATVRIGSRGSDESQGIVMPFWIPDLEGDTILAAELILTQEGEAASWVRHLSNADLYGARSDANSATTIATDYTDPGTLLVDDWFPIQAGQVNDNGIATTEDGELLTWLQQELGTTGQKYVFLTVKPDALHSTANYYMTFHASDSSTAPPKLILTVGTPGGETETITIWRQQYFGTDESTGDAADDANPMGDGLPNIIKYALGLDPLVNHANHPSAPRFYLDEAEGYLYTMTRKPGRDDVTLMLEVSPDLAPDSWTSIDPLDENYQVSVEADTPEAGMETITVRAADTGVKVQFVRLIAIR